MSLVVYDGKTLLDAKNKIDTCNSEILYSLERIFTEFENMDETLSTPKSNASMPIFIDYINKQVDYVRNNRENYNRLIDEINKDYQEYFISVNRTVGGNNGN